MKNSLALGLNLICWVLLFNTVTAQTKKGDPVQNRWAEFVKVDGKLEDWGDSLKYFNEGTRFSFDLSNDQETLYLAIKSKDPENLNRILARGISFSLNSKSKKEVGPTVIFPVIDRNIQTIKPAKPAVQDLNENQKQILSKLSKFHVKGFSEIIDGAVSTGNSYGILTGAGFDDQNNFTVEIAVPFRLLEITPDQQVISCQIEINGVKQVRTSYDPNRNSPRGMYGYPNRDYRLDRRTPVNKQNEATGFRIEYPISKKSNKN